MFYCMFYFTCDRSFSAVSCDLANITGITESRPLCINVYRVIDPGAAGS